MTCATGFPRAYWRWRWTTILLAASVVSCSDSGTDPAEDQQDEGDFAKDYIEAIFLGMGPLIPQDNFTACVTGNGQPFPAERRSA